MPSRRVPPERRKRTEISCDKCKSRKQKCHRPPEPQEGLEHAPCRYCQTHGFECVTTQLRKKRIYASVEGLGTRLAILESLVQGLVPEADTSTIEGMRAIGTSLGIPLPPPESPPPTTLETEESGDLPASRTQQEDVPVLRDQQGQTQYIGPASSYVLQIRIRALFNGGQAQTPGQFFLFGNNPTAKAWVGEVTDLGKEILNSSRSPQTNASESSPAESETPGPSTTSPTSTMHDVVDGIVPDTLIAAYFDNIHADFPVLHEATFREEYERCCLDPSLLATETDPTWICSLLCVLILGRRATPTDTISLKRGQEAEDRWWRKVQALLPSVILTSSVSAVQALLLVALHLNNTNHRDSSWTLTGTAVRIAIAIGMHREAKAPLHTPLVRELRKRVWWTLYELELMQAASLDRPSAIDDAACSTGTPRQAILDMGSSDSMAYSNRLLILLSQACRVVRTINNQSDGGDDTYNGPLSPATTLIRDLRRWKDSLPPHLCLEALGGQQPSSQRAILLLHVQYHHVLCVLSRNAMLALAGRLFAATDDDERDPNANNTSSTSNNNSSSNLNPRPSISSSDATTLSDVCAEAAQESVRLLLRLFSIGGFDAVTWWDFYFLYAAALVLVLNVMCEAKQQALSPAFQSRWLASSQSLLVSCAEVSAEVLENPLVPGTTRRYAIVIMDLNTMSRNLVAEQQLNPGVSTKIEQQQQLQPQLHAQQLHHQQQQPQQHYISVPGPSVVMDHHTHSHMDHGEISEVVSEPQNGVFMSQGPSGIQFIPDMSANFGFPDASWGWREGQWNDIASMLLGNEYGPNQGQGPG